MAQAGCDGRQQLIELLGFTKYLKQRQIFLQRKTTERPLILQELQELARIEGLLAPAPAAQLSDVHRLHRN